MLQAYIIFVERKVSFGKEQSHQGKCHHTYIVLIINCIAINHIESAQPHEASFFSITLATAEEACACLSLTGSGVNAMCLIKHENASLPLFTAAFPMTAVLLFRRGFPGSARSIGRRPAPCTPRRGRSGAGGRGPPRCRRVGPTRHCPPRHRHARAKAWRLLIRAEANTCKSSLLE
jgi:hypothetical protein